MRKVFLSLLQGQIYTLFFTVLLATSASSDVVKDCLLIPVCTDLSRDVSCPGWTGRSVRLCGGAKQHLLSLSCCPWQKSTNTVNVCMKSLWLARHCTAPASYCGTCAPSIYICPCVHVYSLVSPWLQWGCIHFSMAIRVSVFVHILRRVWQLATWSHSFVRTQGIFCVVHTFLFSEKGIKECPTQQC